jgi:hypothetical protein
MGLREWLIPKEKEFFDMLEAQSAIVLRGAEAIADLYADFRDIPAKVAAIKRIEHEGDEKVHAIYEALNKTFITPIDREDIQALASDLDNILDMIDAAASRTAIYEIATPVPACAELAATILGQVRGLRTGVALIRDLKRADEVERMAIEINRLENMADEAMNRSIAALFKSHDPIEIIKHKEVVERLEEATDRCEDVADHLSDIVAKYR